jgi:hypothetical protein
MVPDREDLMVLDSFRVEVLIEDHHPERAQDMLLARLDRLEVRALVSAAVAAALASAKVTGLYVGVEGTPVRGPG